LTGFDPVSGAASDTFSDAFDVLEVWNGFDLARLDRVDQVFREWLAMLARGKRVTATGNSDSHKVHMQWAGYPRTYVRVPDGDLSDPSAVVRALRRGQAFVTNGPFLDVQVDGVGPGETVYAPSGRVVVRVGVQTAPFMAVDRLELYRGTERVLEAPLAEVTPHSDPHRAHRYELNTRVELRGPAPLVVLVRGEQSLERLLDRTS